MSLSAQTFGSQGCNTYIPMYAVLLHFPGKQWPSHDDDPHQLLLLCFPLRFSCVARRTLTLARPLLPWLFPFPRKEHRHRLMPAPASAITASSIARLALYVSGTRNARHCRTLLLLASCYTQKTRTNAGRGSCVVIEASDCFLS